MIYWLYERLLLSGISTLPAGICFMLTGEDLLDAPGKLQECTSWCIEISESVSSRTSETQGNGTSSLIRSLTYHISTPDPERIDPFIPEIRKISGIAHLTLHHRENILSGGTGMDVTVAIGKSGREEIAGCIRQMAIDGISPSDVTEEKIESYLTFKHTPDLVIKTGGYHLTDFLIWQSVYSEIFFSDVNWRLLRKVDLLRALRDYQARIRRFGR
ncbi:MAG: undecaprenyl diphosphate synthase family protein [Methanoregulaceae archaeon]|nr:undecaprenyl diphosphate synthase family protein [Methanoregulaceae archaeon]